MHKKKGLQDHAICKRKVQQASKCSNPQRLHSTYVTARMEPEESLTYESKTELFAIEWTSRGNRLVYEAKLNLSI